jgi:hypothetical protein
MANDTIVSPTPPGAGRALDLYSDEENDHGSQISRGGASAVNTVRSQSNSGPAGGGIAVVGNGAATRITPDGYTRGFQWQGSTAWSRVVPAVVVQPQREFAWPVGRYGWEVVVRWPVNPGNGVDSGMMLTPQDHSRVVTSAQPAILVGNEGGVLTFRSKGAAGVEVVPLVGAHIGPLNDLNKITLLFRHARKARPASFDVWVNDVLTLSRSWVAGHKLPLPNAVGFFTWNTVHAEAGTYLQKMQQHFFSGPDVGTIDK